MTSPDAELRAALPELRAARERLHLQAVLALLPENRGVYYEHREVVAALAAEVEALTRHLADLQWAAGIDGPWERFTGDDTLARVAELRAQGRSVRQIADALRCSRGTAHNLIRKVEAQ